MFNPASLPTTAIRPTNCANILVSIDVNVPDYPVLAAGVPDGVEVAILHPEEDGIEQITQALQRKHFISHGSPGCLYTSSSILNINAI
ncbi:MAG: DUF4347 domain-containing protein [Geitlerinemataceae cyanobacterium]